MITGRAPDRPVRRPQPGRSLARALFVIMTASFLAADGVDRAWCGNRAAENSQSPYIIAANHAGVPLDLLVAIAGAESGYHPWALNIKGHQVFCHTRSEAEAVLANSPTDDVDIGLMQINWKFWGVRIGLDKRELLDPIRNLELGAQILHDGLVRDGSLWHRISNYHSGGPRERDRYNQQVYSAYLRYKRGQLR